MTPNTNMTPGSTWLRAVELLPPTIRQQIKGANDVGYFVENTERYLAMSDADLLRATEACLRNLERLDESTATPDSDLRTLLIPELWERLQSGTRDGLRRLTSTLAEYNPASFWKHSHLWSADRDAAQRVSAHRLRQRVAQLTNTGTAALIEQVRFAIAGSRAADNWGPTACVYEPGFTYRLVPAIAHRLRTRQDGETP